MYIFKTHTFQNPNTEILKRKKKNSTFSITKLQLIHLMAAYFTELKNYATYADVIARYRSCPAVSHICAFIVFPSTWMLLVANSTPMVLLLSRLNSFRVNRDRRLLFPTPESPIRTTEKTKIFMSDE